MEDPSTPLGCSLAIQWSFRQLTDHFPMRLMCPGIWVGWSKEFSVGLSKTPFAVTELIDSLFEDSIPIEDAF